ncbi:MAG: AAA family ATPase [Candidatus Thiodiazotropha sp.]|jgi:type II secretory pathway predicted ATPase ExeA/outer membrane protein OmpA-like peptidoglycan-associated protein
MFESYYKLDANPFRLGADEHFRFAHKSYQKAYSYLKYALDQGEGFIMVTGWPGSGKTTLIRDILAQVDKSKILAINLVTNQLQAEELLRKVALEFGLHAESFNKATLLTRIEDFVTKEYQGGRRAIIVIDEAQNLTLNGLEELRLLSNLQTGSHPLFQFFLVGQDELRSLIVSQGMEQIRQRLIASCQVDAMDAQQTKGYIEHRLGIVGWNEDPAFDEAIFPLIHYLSGGIPRKINHIASRLLLYGALEEKHKFTQEDVWIIARELFDEERLSIQGGDSFTTFKEKYHQGEGLQPEAREIASDMEHIEHTEGIGGGGVSVTKSVTELIEEGKAKLIAKLEVEADEAKAEIKAKAGAEKTEFKVEVEPAIEPEVKEAVDSETGTEATKHAEEFYPYGESQLDFGNQSAAEVQSADKPAAVISTDKTKRVAQPAAAQAPYATSNAYIDESELDALTSEIISEGDFRIQDASTESAESSPDEILNLPSMQAEKRKHEIDEKGGWINTSETVEVDELFSATFSKSLRNIFFIVLAGLFFLMLFVMRPEHVDQLWEGTITKFQSMIKPAEESPTIQTPVESSIIPADPEAPETSDMFDLELTEVDPEIADEKAEIESEGEASPAPEYTAPMVERASKDYVATQSKYQTVEIGDGIEAPAITTPIPKKFQIYFAFDNTNIPDQFKEMLNDLYIVLSLNKASTMTVTGYTDASGDPIYNMNLSIERANAVSSYFTERGISPDRIQVEGRGPVPKSTADEHEELNKRFGNRRVEIVLHEVAE